MRAFKAILPALLLFGLAAPAQAATFTVNSLADGGDLSNGDGVCSTPGSGLCTLRAAVEEASVLAPTDDIVLGPGTHTLSSRLDVISNDLRIRGAGAGATTIRQGAAGRGVLLLSNSNAEIRDLTLTGGSAGSPGAAGGGLYVDPGATQSVLVERVFITDNEAFKNGGGDAVGGGIYKLGSGSLTVRSSTITQNRARYTDPTVGGGAYGGGIEHSDGALNLINTTVGGNQVSGTGGSSSLAFGGGINSSGGATALSHVTVAGNIASGDNSAGGNLASNFSGHLNVDNSIVAYGVAPNGPGCDVSAGGSLTASGRNIESGSSCGFTAPHLSNTNPLLGALADNGGPTLSLLPAAASPAIDAALGCPTPALDQRGVTRPAGSACDIGAVERVPESGPGGEPPTPDLVAPIVSDFRISAPRFRTSRATRRTRPLPRSTKLIFHLSEPSLVDFRFERRAAGRRGHSGSCQRPSRANRGRRGCARWTAAGSLADNLPEGSQSMRFNGNVTRHGRGTTLGAGSYRVRLDATDLAGNRSVPAGGRFRVVG